MSVAYSAGAKVQKQMASRGWTHADIQDTLDNPAFTIDVWDKRIGTPWQAARTYYRADGRNYVTRNERTGEIAQISDRHDLNWRGPALPGSPDIRYGP